MPLYNVYSVPDLKAAADDILQYCLDDFELQQNHTLEFIRLAFGYVSVAIAGGIFLLERKIGWHASYIYIALGVTAYFVLQILSFIWFRIVEKKATYIGTSKTGQTVYIKTEGKKPQGEYVMKVSVNGGPEKVAKAPFNSFVDFNGRVSKEKFKVVITEALGDLAKKTQ